MPRERVYRNAPSNYQLAQRIKKMQREEELKYNDTLIALTVGDDGSDLYLLNDLATGDTQITRTAGEVYNTSIQYRGYIFIGDLPSPHDQDPIICRMIIFWDSAPNGTTPTILGSPTTSGDESLLDNTSGGVPVFLPYNHSTATRFKILSDKTYSFNLANPDFRSGATTQVIYPNIVLQDKIKLSRKTVYTGPTAAIGAMSINALYVLFLSTLPGTTTDYLSGEFVFRHYFKDD